MVFAAAVLPALFGVPVAAQTLPAGTLTDATLREVVHLSAGGSKLPVKVSNVVGCTPLVLSSVHVALRPAG